MIELKKLGKAIQVNKMKKIHLFHDVNISIQAGESVAIMGRSGSGKTTLLKILAGLIVDYDGAYYFQGSCVAKHEKQAAAFRRQHIGYITQQFHLVHNRSVRQNVRIGNENVSRTMINEMLMQLGLDQLAKEKVRNLSGGECQRVVIARVLLKRPTIILADEPTGSLDEESGKQVLYLFEQLMQSGTQCIIVTHDKTVANTCHRIFELKEKQLHEVTDSL